MRAWVIGNGPSLNETPLDLLKDEVTFGLNRIHLIYDKVDWRPTYWVYTDIQDLPMNRWVADCLFHLDQDYHCFIWSNLTTMIELKRGPWAYWKTNVTWIPLCKEHVSMDSSSPRRPNSWHLPTLCKFGTGSAVALQLAVLAGYNPIYVVGMDLGFQSLGDRRKRGPDINHFDEDYLVVDMHSQNPIGANLRNATHRHAHRLARSGAAERGITIYNAGVGGELEIYPRVTIEEVLDGIHGPWD